jgi:hypothetical protein
MTLPPLPTEPQPGIYRHYKGNLYRVVCLARHSESLESLVVYQALYGTGDVWVRPAEMFQEYIEVEGKNQLRFERMDESEISLPEPMNAVRV